jgi:hypothetical protein
MSSSTVSASAIPSLCIGYALDRCSVEQVAEIFNYIIDDNEVDNVKVLDKTNNTTQRPFKIFFINFKRTSDKLAGIVARIEEEQFIRIEYDGSWFWKVTLAKKKDDDKPAEKKGPRIMGRDE